MIEHDRLIEGDGIRGFKLYEQRKYIQPLLYISYGIFSSYISMISSFNVMFPTIILLSDDREFYPLSIDYNFIKIKLYSF